MYPHAPGLRGALGLWAGVTYCNVLLPLIEIISTVHDFTGNPPESNPAGSAL
jgi:hypothetical protein